MARKQSRPTASRRPSKTAASRRQSKTATSRRQSKTRPRVLSADIADAIGQAATIVYVHGIGNKPIESILKCQWDHALFGYDLGERSRLAYWVNREYYPAPSSGTCATGDRTELEDTPTGRALSVEQHLEHTPLSEEVEALTDDPDEQAVLMSLLSKVDAHTVPARVGERRATGLEGLILPLPEPWRQWITRKLTRAFARDVNDYLFVDARRQQMRQALIDRLTSGGGPFVVVAHSQGSMIAYDVLSSMPDVDVALLLTIGSPLGIQEVQDRLKGFTSQRKLAVPPSVKRWVNVYDDRDPIAVDEKLADDYAATNGIAVEDVEVSNLDSPAHPHSGTGYLRTDAARHAVRDAVSIELFQPVAPFVIARNLVRRLENAPREVRHSVLIELADPAKSGTPLEETAEKLTARITTLTGRTEDEIRLQRMRRYLAAYLTRSETETLATQFAAGAVGAQKAPAGLLVRRIWRNESKRALLNESVHAIHAGAAHSGYRAFGSDIAWAVLDSGVNAEHPHFELHRNIVSQVDCTGRGVKVGAAPDQNGHGTHVAGIIAGSRTFDAVDGEPAVVVSGIAPEARLHIYKVLDREGEGEDAWIIKALDHIADTNERAGRLVIHGVNLSLGGPFDQSTYGCGHTPLCDELRRLWRQGVLVVLAAGNEGFAVLRSLDGDLDANIDLSIADPANLEDAIAVGSVHKTNPHTYGISYFSSRGPTADGRQKPDVVAPGERIVSCRHRMPKRRRGINDEYVAMSGTSMAAPHVSGALAAFLSVRREFIGESDRVKQHLLNNCTDLGRDRFQQGAGLPNLVKMLINT